ncbi:kama family protein [Whalleya microplaca]|nr:kama family protein [Whalleya microplaca]
MFPFIRNQQTLIRRGGCSSVSRVSSSLTRPISITTQRRSLVSEATAPSIPQPTQERGPIESVDEYWRTLPPWKHITHVDFMSWAWAIKNMVEGKEKLHEFLDAVLPDEVPRRKGLEGMQSRDGFMGDVAGGMKASAMSVKVTPYVLSRVNWKDPANDPIFNQFIPLRSVMLPDHPQLEFDSLHEAADSPVDGVVHRYPDKALFLPISVCPTYCIFCTRSYGVGRDTELLTKQGFKLSRPRLEAAFAYIESQEGLKDIVVSGGDAYYLPPHILNWIGDRLINMKNVERFRIASKGLAVGPTRILDKQDPWADALINVSDKARRAGKQMALHTHFNHPNEISWITEKASLKLMQSGVTVRNQTVLTRGINDNVETMFTLIQKLSKMGIQPYYVYQGDMVPKVEHLRTPLQTIIDLDSQIQGLTAGYNTPKFVVDLPGGGGKRQAAHFESYDRRTGVSTFTAPGLTRNGKGGKVYRYYDPVDPVKSA